MSELLRTYEVNDTTLNIYKDGINQDEFHKTLTELGYDICEQGLPYQCGIVHTLGESVMNGSTRQDPFFEELYPTEDRKIKLREAKSFLRFVDRTLPDLINTSLNVQRDNELNPITESITLQGK